MTEDNLQSKSEQQKKAIACLKRKLQRYHDHKYCLALRNNPSLTREEWEEQFFSQMWHGIGKRYTKE